MTFKQQKTLILPDMVPLYVSSSEYNNMRKSQDWPEPSQFLVYKVDDNTWNISKQHSDFEKMTERFGVKNASAVEKWQQEIDDDERALRKLLAEGGYIEVDDRLYLPHLNKQIEKFLRYKDQYHGDKSVRSERENSGAQYDRTKKMYCVSFHRKDIEDLIKIYSV